MREQDIFPSKDGEDEEEASEKHEKDENGKNQTEDERKGGMNVLHPYHRNVPEKKDEEKKNQTAKNQQSDEDSLLWFNIQCNLMSSESSVRSSEYLNIFYSKLKTPNS